jgi:hypothetical protein
VHARRTRPESTAFMLARPALIPVEEAGMTMDELTARNLSSTNHHGCFSTASPVYCHDPLNPGKADTLCPSNLEQLATTYRLPDFVEALAEYHSRRRHRDFSLLALDENVPQDGAEMRLLPAFLRLCAARALRDLQTKLSPDVFLRGLRLQPEWASDVRLCRQLGVEPVPSKYVDAKKEADSTSTLSTTSFTDESLASLFSQIRFESNNELPSTVATQQHVHTAVGGDIFHYSVPEQNVLPLHYMRQIRGQLDATRGSGTASSSSTDARDFEFDLNVINRRTANEMYGFHQVSGRAQRVDSHRPARTELSSTKRARQLHAAMFDESASAAPTIKSLRRKKPAGGRR